MERKESFMIRRLLCAWIGATVLGALAVSAPVAAKPPDLPEDGAFEVLPMPHEDSGVTCPYLRQQRIDRHACQIADPDMSRGALDNLKRLRQADKLLDRAQKLARAGFISEAMECCARAATLCPGSPCANRAADTLVDLALGFVMPAGGSEEASEDTTPSVAPTIHYEFEIGTNADEGLRVCANCSLGGSVYHLRYKHGCLSIWKTADAGKTKP
jgi:hypothetical protein